MCLNSGDEMQMIFISGLEYKSQIINPYHAEHFNHYLCK